MTLKRHWFKGQCHIRHFQKCCFESMWTCYWWFWNSGQNEVKSKVKVKTTPSVVKKEVTTAPRQALCSSTSNYLNNTVYISCSCKKANNDFWKVAGGAPYYLIRSDTEDRTGSEKIIGKLQDITAFSESCRCDVRKLLTMSARIDNREMSRSLLQIITGRTKLHQAAGPRRVSA